MRLESLPKGITGFFSFPDRLPQVDFKRFKTACYSVSQACGFKVEALDDDLSDKNYFVAQLAGRELAVAVLCNAMFRYVAFVPGHQHLAHDPDFISDDSLHTRFSDFTLFSPLDADWLNDDISPVHLAQLAEAELEQLSYWKKSRVTRTVGHVIFNRWD